MRWLRRIAIALAVVLGTGAALTAIVLTILSTQMGQRAILNAALPFLEKRSGIAAEVGGTGGVWPQDIQLRDVKLRDTDGEWLEAGRLRLRWCVPCALGGEILVKSLTLEGGGISRRPKLRKAEEKPGAEEPGALPVLRVEALQVADFAIGPGLVEGGSTLNLLGSAHTEEGRRVLASLEATLTAPGGADGPVAKWVGETIALEAGGQFDRAGGTALLERLVIAGPKARMEGSALRYGAGGVLGGRLSLHLKVPDTASATLRRAAGEALHLTAELSGRLPEGAGLSGTSLKNANGAGLLSGSATVHDLAQNPRLEAGFRLEPALANALAENWVPSAPLEISLKVEDLKAAPRLEAVVSGSVAQWNGNPLPAFRAVLAVRNLAALPEGTLDITAADEGGTAGTAKIAFALEGGKTVRIPALDIRYGTARAAGDAVIGLSPLSAVAAFEANIPDLAELPQFAALSGDMRAKGRVEYRDAGGAVKADLSSARLSVGTVSTTGMSLSAGGPLSAMRFQAGAAAVDGLDAGDIANAKISGVLKKLPGSLAVELGEFSVLWSGTPIRLQEKTQVFLAGEAASLSRTALAWGDAGRLTLEGSAAGGGLKGRLTAERAILPFTEFMLDGTAGIDTGARAPGAFDLRITPLGPEAPEVFVDLEGRWNGTRVALDGALQGRGGLEDFGRHRLLSGTVPFALHRQGGGLGVDTSGEADLAIRYSAEAGPLFALAPVPDQTLSGQLDIDFRIRGPLAALEAGGGMGLSGGVYEHLRAGTRLTDMQMQVKASGSAANPSLALTLRANDGSTGRSIETNPAMTGEGRVRRSEEGMTVDAALTLDKARMIQRDDFTGVFSGDARLRGTLPRLSLGGTLTVDSLNAYIPDPPPGQAVDVAVVRMDGGAEVKEPEAEAPPVIIDLDLRIRADGRVFIRGRGLESEWTSDLLVGGTSIDPRLRGPVSIKRGTFEFGGRVFDLERGRILFVPLLGTDPSLDLRAKAEIPSGETVYVTVSGRASSPDLSLSSQPALPEEDVMSLILFGKPATKLSAFESLQVANAVATLSGKSPLGSSGPGVLDRARDALGLDLLQVGAGENGLSDAGLTVGKYVADGVRVSASQDVSGKGGEVTVEVEVTDSISVETDVGQDASGSVSVFWSRDY